MHAGKEWGGAGGEVSAPIEVATFDLQTASYVAREPRGQDPGAAATSSSASQVAASVPGSSSPSLPTRPSHA